MSPKQWDEFLRQMGRVRDGWRINGNCVSILVDDLRKLVAEVERSRKEATTLRARARRNHSGKGK